MDPRDPGGAVGVMGHHLGGGALRPSALTEGAGGLRVRAGEELTVTDRARPIARLVPVDRPHTFDQLVAEGLVARAATRDRHRPTTRVATTGPVSELVAEQRR